MADYVIRIVGPALDLPDNHWAHGMDGQYVASYDPSGNRGHGKITTTFNPAEAMRFATQFKALEAWRSVSQTHPVREDGKPNRPLTAWTVATEEVQSLNEDPS